MGTRTTTVICFAGILSVPFALGCPERRRVLNPEHCANNGGDSYCAEVEPDAPYCTIGIGACSIGPPYGCVADPPAECREPCGMDGGDECLEDSGSSASDSGSGTDAETTDTDGDSSSTNSSTTGPMPCLEDDDCGGGAAPFCDPAAGECVSCSALDDPDGACASLSADEPLCVEGACVACTAENPEVCDEQLLLCDGEMNACIACSQHEQCESGACELAVGRCFAPDVVVHVDGDGGQDFETVAAAVGAVDEGMHGVIVVHELDGVLPYLGLVDVDAGKTIAILSAPGEAPIVQGTGGNAGVRVAGADTTLYVDGLSVAGNTGGLGLEVDESTAWVDRSRIVQNSGGGVVAQNAAELVLRNSFVGGSVTNVSVLDVNDASATLLYSTVIGGLGGLSTGVTCTPGATVSVSNSIVLLESDNPPVTCDPAVFDHSVSETALPGEGNVSAGDFNDLSGWFTSVAGGDFHLATAPAAIGTTAQWQDGDPATDIDGDARPMMDGASDYAGADVP